MPDISQPPKPPTKPAPKPPERTKPPEPSHKPPVNTSNDAYMAEQCKDIAKQMLNQLNGYPESRRNAPLARLSFHIEATPNSVRWLYDFLKSF